MEELNKLVGREIQQLVEVHPTEGELAECAALGLLGVSLKTQLRMSLGAAKTLNGMVLTYNSTPWKPSYALLLCLQRCRFQKKHNDRNSAKKCAPW